MSPVTQRQQQQASTSGGGHGRHEQERGDTIPQKINTNEFYGEYHGHKIKHLKSLYQVMRNDPNTQRIIWTAGDSSLDNKYWFQDIKPAVANTAYSQLLHPTRSNADITYYMNLLCQQQQNGNGKGSTSNSHRSNWATINTAGTYDSQAPSPSSSKSKSPKNETMDGKRESKGKDEVVENGWLGYDSSDNVALLVCLLKSFS